MLRSKRILDQEIRKTEFVRESIKILLMRFFNVEPAEASIGEEIVCDHRSIKSSFPKKSSQRIRKCDQGPNRTNETTKPNVEDSKNGDADFISWRTTELKQKHNESCDEQITKPVVTNKTKR